MAVPLLCLLFAVAVASSLLSLLFIEGGVRMLRTGGPALLVGVSAEPACMCTHVCFVTIMLISLLASSIGVDAIHWFAAS